MVLETLVLQQDCFNGVGISLSRWVKDNDSSKKERKMIKREREKEKKREGNKEKQT